MPAISATFTMKTRKASDFAELLQIGWEPEKEITDIQLARGSTQSDRHPMVFLCGKNRREYREECNE